jgi:hypothetical protein
MFPANSHVIRPATPADEHALRRLARADGRTPLRGRILVAEVRGQVAAAISRDESRTLQDPAIAPAYVTTLLRRRAEGIAAYEREPELRARVLEALRRPWQDEQLPLAA